MFRGLFGLVQRVDLERILLPYNVIIILEWVQEVSFLDEVGFVDMLVHFMFSLLRSMRATC